jgi:GDPmannose 4,6-dehydratase
MLQRDVPGDYVIATGRTTSVREFCRIAFSYAHLNYEDYITVRPDMLRPAEVELLLGDASKAKRELDWEPTISLEDMIAEMVEADLARHHARLRA